MGSQVIGEDRRRLSGRRTVGEGGRRASDRAMKRVNRLSVRFGRERRASGLPCLSLGDDRRSKSRSRDVSLAIFITSVSGIESLASFTNRFIRFGGSPGFRRAFNTSKKKGRFGRIRCQRSKDTETEKRDEYSSAEQ